MKKIIMILGLMLLLTMSMAAAETRVCASVCTPMYDSTNGCELDTCGSGCGPNGETTFESKAKCEGHKEIALDVEDKQVRKQIRLQVDKNTDMVELYNNTQVGVVDQTKLQQMIQTTTKLKDRLNLNCEEKCYFNVVEEDNTTQIEQVDEVKFLGFNAKAKNKFTIDADGNIIKQKKNFIQYFYNWGIAKKFAGATQ